MFASGTGGPSTDRGDKRLPDASVRHVDLPDGADAGDVGVAELKEILEPFL